MTPLPPDTPDDWADIHDEGWVEDSDGRWVGIIAIISMIAFVLAIVALYQWRM